MDIPIILSIGNEKIQDDLLVAQKWHSETGKMTWDIPGYAQAIVNKDHQQNCIRCPSQSLRSMFSWFCPYWSYWVVIVWQILKYPLVIIAMENHYSNGQIHDRWCFSIAMLHIVKLPEGVSPKLMDAGFRVFLPPTWWIVASLNFVALVASWSAGSRDTLKLWEIWTEILTSQEQLYSFPRITSGALKSVMSLAHLGDPKVGPGSR